MEPMECQYHSQCCGFCETEEEREQGLCCDCLEAEREEDAERQHALEMGKALQRIASAAGCASSIPAEIADVVCAMLIASLTPPNTTVDTLETSVRTSWYGQKNKFVATRAFNTRAELDSWNTALVAVCGIGVDFLSVGPNPLNVDPSKAPNEWINDIADAWDDAAVLRSYLADIQQDKATTSSRSALRSEFNRQLYFDLTVAEELLIQRISEIES